jgi:hypothetical protein
MAHSPGVTEQEVQAILMGERRTEIGADDTEATLGTIESELRCPCSIPAFAIELTSELRDLLGTIGKPRMRLNCVEAISSNPRLLDVEIRMPIVHHCAAAFLDDHLEISVRW